MTSKIPPPGNDPFFSCCNSYQVRKQRKFFEGTDFELFQLWLWGCTEAQFCTESCATGWLNRSCSREELHLLTVSRLFQWVQGTHWCVTLCWDKLSSCSNQSSSGSVTQLFATTECCSGNPCYQFILSSCLKLFLSQNNWMVAENLKKHLLSHLSWTFNSKHWMVSKQQNITVRLSLYRW